MCEPALEQLVQFAHAATAAPADAAQLGRGIGVVWAHSGGFRIRPAIVASNACPCRAGPAPLPLQRLPASTDAGWNAAPHVRRRSLSRRWHVSGPPCAVQALAPCGAAIPCPSAGTLRGRRTLGICPTPRDDILSLLRAVAHPCATWDTALIEGEPRARRPSRTYRSWLRSEKQTRARLYYRRPIVEPPAVFRPPSSVKAASDRTAVCQGGQPRDRSAAPNAPKDAVLPQGGSSGTWMPDYPHFSATDTAGKHAAAP